MKTVITPKLDRREFIQTAGAAIGLAVIGSIELPARADNNSERNISLGYFDGQKLTDSQRISTITSSSVSSKVKLTIFGEAVPSAQIRAVDVYYAVDTVDGQRWLPHMAWTRSDFGSSRADVVVPVAQGRIRMAVHLANTHTLLDLNTTGQPADAKLAIGSYVLVPGSASWTMHSFETCSNLKTPGRLLDRTLSGFKPSRLEFVTIQVENA